MQTPLEMHDALLLSAPSGARHAQDVCPFCLDWALLEDGTPSGLSNGRLLLDAASAKAPYGDVEYADPGYLADQVKRYPLDTESHARSSWTHVVTDARNGRYTDDQASAMEAAVNAALVKFDVVLPITEEDADTAPSVNSDAASEGGTNKHMDTISKDTHEALLAKAVSDAIAAVNTEKAALETKVSELTATTEGLTSEVAALKADNTRVSTELDTAQVSLKAATDEVASLKTDIASREEAAQRADIARARAEQVRNLGLFGEEYITEKASKWSEIDEAGWTDRLDEWKAAKGTAVDATSTTSTTTDTASAMTGTRGASTGGDSTARRSVLGLS